MTASIPTERRGDVGLPNYTVTLAFPDLFKAEDQDDVVFGLQPK